MTLILKENFSWHTYGDTDFSFAVFLIRGNQRNNQMISKSYSDRAK